MTIAVIAYRSRDGRLYETEPRAHEADRLYLREQNQKRIFAVLGIDRWSGREASDIGYRVIERWDAPLR